MKYLILSIVILVLSFLNVLRPIEHLGAAALSPFTSSLRIAALDIRDYASFIINIRRIYIENQALKEEILDLRAKEADLTYLQEENQVLKEQFLPLNEPDISLSAPYPRENLVMAQISGNPSDLTNSTVYVNAGTKKGVTLGASVIYKNYLIGSVSQVEPYRSLVNLVYSPDLVIAVKDIDTKNQTEGIVSGDYGTSLKMERVLQKESLATGDVLVTSGREGFFEPGYIVGRVGDIYEIPTEPLKSAEVIPFIDIESLDFVFVLSKEGAR